MPPSRSPSSRRPGLVDVTLRLDARASKLEKERDAEKFVLHSFFFSSFFREHLQRWLSMVTKARSRRKCPYLRGDYKAECPRSVPSKLALLVLATSGSCPIRAEKLQNGLRRVSSGTCSSVGVSILPQIGCRLSGFVEGKWIFSGAERISPMGLNTFWPSARNAKFAAGGMTVDV